MATYTQREMEAAVALSGDLHAHRSFEEYCARQHLCEATDRWQICVQAGVALEAAAQVTSVEWGASHDFLIAVGALVEILLTQDDQNVQSAVRQALATAENPR